MGGGRSERMRVMGMSKRGRVREGNEGRKVGGWIGTDVCELLATLYA